MTREQLVDVQVQLWEQRPVVDAAAEAHQVRLTQEATVARPLGVAAGANIITDPTVF